MLCEWSSKSSIPIFVKMPLPQGLYVATSTVVVEDDKSEVNPFLHGMTHSGIGVGGESLHI
jgi:hypothetical protein